MKKTVFAALVLCLIPGIKSGFSAEQPHKAGQPSKPEVAIQSEICNYDNNIKMFTGEGNVKIYYGEFVVTGDKIIINHEEKDLLNSEYDKKGPVILKAENYRYFPDYKAIMLEGNASMQYGAHILTGNKIIINRTGDEISNNADSTVKLKARSLKYFPVTRKIVLEGDIRLEDGKKTITGNNIIIE